MCFNCEAYLWGLVPVQGVQLWQASIDAYGRSTDSILISADREGRAWVSPSGISGSCEGYVPLLERLQRTCIARLAAACEVPCSTYIPSHCHSYDCHWHIDAQKYLT